MRSIIKKLREKYKGALGEIDDLRSENELNKGDLLDVVRLQEKDLKFANRVIEIVLNPNEMYKIRDKARWNEDKKDWKIPLFYF